MAEYKLNINRTIIQFFMMNIDKYWYLYLDWYKMIIDNNSPCAFFSKQNKLLKQNWSTRHPARITFGRRPLSYWNQFLYDIGLCHKRVKVVVWIWDFHCLLFVSLILFLIISENKQSSAESSAEFFN